MNCARCTQKDCTEDGSPIEAKYSGEILEIARVASFIEATYFMKKTRFEELIEFAKVIDKRELA